MTFDGFLELGNKAFDAGDYDGTILNLTKAIELNSDVAGVHKNRGIAYSKQNKYEEAIADYTEAIELDPSGSDAYFLRGIAYSNQNKYDEAMADYTTALEVNPSNADIYYNRGFVYSNQNKYEEAIADYTKAIEQDSGNVSAYINRGNAYGEQGKYEEAIADYTDAIGMGPEYVNAYYNRGNVYRNQHKCDEAIADYTRAIELDPSDADGYNNRGDAYFNQNNYDKAITDYTEAIRIDSESAYAYNNRSNAYFNQNNHDKAITDDTEAIRIDSKSANAYNNRGSAYINQNNYDKAITDYISAIEIAPNEAIFYNNLLLTTNQEKSLAVIENHLLDFLTILDSIKYSVPISDDIETAIFGLNSIEKRELKQIRNNAEFDDVVNLDNGNNKVLTKIIDIIIQIHNLKVSLLVNDGINETFYQYTQLGTLKSLLNLSSTTAENMNNANVNVRMYNTDYMNDPDEGETLLSYLDLNQSLNNDEQYKASHSFIASLTPKEQKDSIPMWRMYGDDYQGVSIGFSGFPVWQDRNAMSSTTEQENVENNIEETRPQLYKVLYVDNKHESSDNDDSQQGLDKLIAVYKAVKELKAGLTESEKSTVNKFIIKELGFVTFLVKNRNYEYENEFRLLQITNSFEEAKYDSGNKKLYMEYNSAVNPSDESTINLKIEEIIFGVDSDLPIHWAPMVEKKLGTDVTLSKTTIHYRSK